MKRLLLLLIVVLSHSSLFAEVTPARRYLVATRGHLRAARIPLQDLDGHEVMSFRSVEGFAALLTDEEVAVLRRSPNVRYIEPDYELRASSTASNLPNTPVIDRLAQRTPYGIELVKATKVWSVGSGQRIKVAVIDTGIDSSHPDLRDHFRGGYDFIENDLVPQDGNGHGTHVGGTIAALNNEFGVVGVAPNVDLYALRILNDAGSGNASSLIRAIDWSITNGMNVLNLSLGFPEPSALAEQAFQRAADAGIIAVAASGNDYADLKADGLDYPAGYPTVISVGAIGSNSVVASFSQRGPQLKLVAPGVAVSSSVRTGTGAVADVELRTGALVNAKSLTGSPLGEISGDYFNAGRGRTQDFTSEAAGKIALIERDGLSIPSDQRITFNEKTRNAKTAGAVGVLIYNNVPGSFSGTLIGQTCDATGKNCTDNAADLQFDWPLTLSISQEDGLALRSNPSGAISLNARASDYGELQGTSMAAPHVAGVMALAWSVAPNASASQVRDVVISTAVDLGEPGLDTVYGNGLPDALAAAKRLAPEQFPAPPARIRGRR